MQQHANCEFRSSAGLRQLFSWIGLCLGVCARDNCRAKSPIMGWNPVFNGGLRAQERKAAPKSGCGTNAFWLCGLRGIVEVASSEPAQLRVAQRLRCGFAGLRGLAGLSGVSVLHQQPVMEAVDDGHQGGLVQVAADACGDPRLVTVGDKADGDAHVGG